jgi:hypothetical protein
MAVQRIGLEYVGRRFHRTRLKVQRPAIRLHARHTGEIVIAWNGLQGSLFMLFAALFGDIHKQHFAHKIWHTIQSDKTQREMLYNAAEAFLGARCPELLADIKWGLDRAGDLSPYRNDAAHTAIWTVAQPSGRRTVMPDPYATRFASMQRLVETPTAAIWQKVRGDLYALTEYVALIEAHVRYGPLVALKSRPRLQAVQEKQTKSRRGSHPPNAAKRKRRPRS